jgi:polysaccharide biosynthesis protein PslG
MNFRQAVLAAMVVGAMTVSTVPASGAAGSKVEPWRTGQPSFTPPAGTTPIVGVQFHGIWSDRPPAVRHRILSELAAAGVKYVRLDISWASLQPRGPFTLDLQYGVPETDRRIREIADHGMRTLMMLHWAPAWSSGTSDKNGVPRDPREYGRAAAFAAKRWQGNLAGIELLNEPDSSAFLANTDPGTYTALVKAAYTRIKAAAPNVKVIAGAPTYVKTSWFQKFFELGGAGHYDALGIHPYMGFADAPPSACDPYDIEYYPCNIPNLVDLMRANGDSDPQIWVTEYGWSSHPNSAYPDPIPNWKRGVSQAQQAQYMIDMQSLLSQWPQVKASFWYAAWDKDSGDVHEDNWGLLTRNFARKPAFYAMRCIAGGVCGPAQAPAPQSPVTPKPAAPTPAPTTPNPGDPRLGPVRKLRVGKVRKKRATASWKRPRDAQDLQGYRVRWARAKKSGAWVVTDERFLVVRGLKPGKKYRLSVAAIGEAGKGTKTSLTYRHRR